jgi:hypothetical protein|tara:strand:- start:680 stop:850 length:171 start_codon:yes stop_codon:yes gene_type:complete
MTNNPTIQQLLIRKKNLEEALEWKHNQAQEDELYETNDTLKKLGYDETKKSAYNFY